MSSTRWWTPWTRWRRDAPAVAGSAAPVARSAEPTPPSVPAAAHARATPAESPSPTPGAADATPTPLPETSLEQRCGFVGWLLAAPVADPPASHAPMPEGVRRMLARLDLIIASDTQRASLLPRAPHVVPQLMKTLRDESYSSVDVAQRISKDVVLTAEVIRSATRAFQRDDDVEIDLGRAVAVIGTAGLRRAIASVVLRPIFDARGDTLSARAALPIWKDADRKARLGAAIATQFATDPFDGYLAGLLHNTGWTAALRAIDGLQDTPVGIDELTRPEVVEALYQRRDRLFGALVEPWQLSPAVTQLAAEIGRDGLAAAPSPLGAVLRGAERLSLLRALAADGASPAQSVPEWEALAEPVRECYAGLGAS